MRISTNQLHESGIGAILDRQVQVNRTQQQIAIGSRLLAAADDPAAAARLQDLAQALDTARQHQRNAEFARNRLQLAEGVLADGGRILQRARELALQGNNDTQTAATRALLATEARQLREQMLALANTRDGSGEFLFAGFRVTTQPFSADAAGGITYHGDDGSRALQISATQQVVAGDPGSALFRDIRNGNGRFVVTAALANTGSALVDPGNVVDESLYLAHDFRIVFTSASTYDVLDLTTGTTVVGGVAWTGGAAIEFNGSRVAIAGAPAAGDVFDVTPSTAQDVFTSLRQLADALERPAGTAQERARFHNDIAAFLAGIDQAELHLVEARTRIGARLRVIDDQQSVNEAFALQIEETAAALRDTDLAQAASLLSAQLTALEAAQRSFVLVQNLSLFNFLR
jgi:flagellar hook-associated protein 3 FlgL